MPSTSGEAQKLFDLLPAAYTGAVEEIKKELNDLVGLAPVKEYVFGLADNIAGAAAPCGGGPARPPASRCT